MYFRTDLCLWCEQRFNPKKAWKSINNLLGRQNKQTVVNELNVNEDNLTSPEERAERALINHFLNIGPDFASKIDTSNYNFETC